MLIKSLQYRKHRRCRAIDHAGGIIQYGYDTQGRVLSSEKANGAEKLTFSYGTNSTTIKDITNAKTITHSFGTAQGVIRPTKISGASPLCGNTAAATTYDANGNVTQRNEHDGTITKFTYDAKNRETSRVEAAGTTAAKTYTTQWHATWNLPLLRAEPLKITAYIYDEKGNLTGQAETPTTDASGVLGVAGVRDVAKPIESVGWTFNLQNLQTRVLRNTQTKNVQGVWVTAIGSDITAVFDVMGNLLKSADVINSTSTTANNYGTQGLLNNLFLNGITNTALTYNARAKLNSLNIGGVVVAVDRDGTQRINRVIFSNVNRIFTYSYDQGQNLTQIADNWGNKIIFTFTGGIRAETYIHANQAQRSANSLKELDTGLLDARIAGEAIGATHTISNLTKETLSVSSLINAYFDGIFADGIPTKNYYGQPIVEHESFSFMSKAYALSNAFGGKNPLYCIRDCYAECAHLLPSPSGDRQSSEFRRCYGLCTGRLW
jgi:YD repeat-containing protein